MDRSLETINLISCTNHSNPFSSSTFQLPHSTCFTSISEPFSRPQLFPQKKRIVKWEGPLMWSSVGPLVSLECLYNPTEHISTVTAWRKALHFKKTPSFQLCGKVSWVHRWRMTISPLLKLHCCTAGARKLVYSMKVSSRCVCGSKCVFALDHICNMYRSESIWCTHALVVGRLCLLWVNWTVTCAT